MLSTHSYTKGKCCHSHVLMVTKPAALYRGHDYRKNAQVPVISTPVYSPELLLTSESKCGHSFFFTIKLKTGTGIVPTNQNSLSPPVTTTICFLSAILTLSNTAPYKWSQAECVTGSLVHSASHPQGSSRL